MKAKELMDKKFVYISPEDSVKDVSITMEKYVDLHVLL